jgi:TRAP-type mannitol/chloroaromatic compound transport system permease small subunit
MAILRIIDKISRWAAYVAAALMAIATVGILTDVVTRYFLHFTIVWLQETVTFCFGSAVMLGAAYTLQKGGHVRIDAFFSKLSPRRQALMDICTFVFFFIFILAVVWTGWQDTVFSYSFQERTQTVWGPVIWPYKFILVFAALLMLLQGVAQLIRNIMIVTGREEK